MLARKQEQAPPRPASSWNQTVKPLIINSLFYPTVTGGAERSVQLIAEGLKNLGSSPVVVTTDDRNHSESINGVPVRYLAIANLYGVQEARQQPAFKKPFWHTLDTYNPLMARAVGRVLDEERPDIVHTNNLTGFSCSVWTAAHDRNIPVVHTIRDHYLLCLKSTMFRNGKNCASRCTLCALTGNIKRRRTRAVDAVVGVSDYILERHLQAGYFQTTPITTVIRNVVGSTSENDEGSIAPENSIVRFGIIGALVEGKGLDYVLSRFTALGLPGAELHIFGRGQSATYEEQLRNRYAQQAVIFHGQVPASQLYSTLDVVLIPSLWGEAFPRVFIESMQFGKPVIVSNRGGSPEMVQPGVNGWIYDPEVPGDLESRLRAAVDNRSQLREMAAACGETAREFTQDRICGQYQQLFQRILTIGASRHV